MSVHLILFLLYGHSTFQMKKEIEQQNYKSEFKFQVSNEK